MDIELINIKLLMYEFGIYVDDKLYLKIKESEYSGYRTTSGIFIKIGGCKSKDELCDKDSYLEYLKIREYVTTHVYKLSDLDRFSVNYCILKLDENGDFYIEGQYKINDKITTFLKNDVGIYVQFGYDDNNPVVVQAGGSRIRVSICGQNCISGCTFCTFGQGEFKYKTDFLNNEYKKLILNELEKFIECNDIKYLFVTGGNPSLNDLETWTDFLKLIIITFKKSIIRKYGKYIGHIDVMLTPRGFKSYVDSSDYINYLKYLKGLGVDTLSPNMELWEQNKLIKYCPSNSINKCTTKSEIGHDNYLKFLEEAVKIFGKFNVRTALIVGLNNYDEVKDAINELVNKYIMVVLSPFRAPECIQNSNRYSQNLKDLEPSIDLMIACSHFLNSELSKYYSNQECLNNISVNLSAHNMHNTANMSSGTMIDNVEFAALKKNCDLSIIRNYKDL